MDRQECPVCGVIKVWSPVQQAYVFETWASRNMGCSNMSASAFNTKCCQYVKQRKSGCINENNGYDARYDVNRTDIIEDMKDQKVLEIYRDIYYNNDYDD